MKPFFFQVIVRKPKWKITGNAYTLVSKNKIDRNKNSIRICDNYFIKWSRKAWAKHVSITFCMHNCYIVCACICIFSASFGAVTTNFCTLKVKMLRDFFPALFICLCHHFFSFFSCGIRWRTSRHTLCKMKKDTTKLNKSRFEYLC